MKRIGVSKNTIFFAAQTQNILSVFYEVPTQAQESKKFFKTHLQFP